MAIALATLITIVFLSGSWMVDQRILKCATPTRAICAIVLLAIATWIVLAILLSRLFEVPGAYGPVQFWVGENTSLMDLVRRTSMFLVMFGVLLIPITIILTLVTAWKTKQLKSKIFLLPVVAFCAYGGCCWAMVHYTFYPSA